MVSEEKSETNQVRNERSRISEIAGNYVPAIDTQYAILSSVECGPEETLLSDNAFLLLSVRGQYLYDSFGL